MKAFDVKTGGAGIADETPVASQAWGDQIKVRFEAGGMGSQQQLSGHLDKLGAGRVAGGKRRPEAGRKRPMSVSGVSGICVTPRSAGMHVPAGPLGAADSPPIGRGCRSAGGAIDSSPS